MIDQTSSIHPTAIIHPRAELDTTVTVGPYAVIGPYLHIAGGCSIGAHAVLDGRTTLGRDNTIFPFAVIGTIPQDKKYGGESTALVIGERNTIREFVTFNTGTAQDQGVTRIGDDNWIMAYVHIAHDCQIGHRNILANNTTLAGHVRVADDVLLGGFTTVHQFCRIGAYAMTAAAAAVSQDVPPFVRVAGNRAAPVGINSEGLRRHGLSTQQIIAIKHGYKIIYREGYTLSDAQVVLQENEKCLPDAACYLSMLRQFIAAPSSRGIVR